MHWYNAQFCLHWGRCSTPPRELPNVGPGDAPKGVLPGLGGGLNGCICAVSACNSVKKMRSIGLTRSFHCIGGGVVPPPMSCRTLGRAMCRKARRLAMAEASMDVSVPCVLAIL